MIILTIRFANRFAQTQKLMAEKKVDFLLITNRENLIYFTGLTQIECMAIIIARSGEPTAVTLHLDSNYVEQESGLTTCGYLFPQETLVDKIVEIIERYGLQEPRIGFERYFVDYALYDGLRRNFSEKNFVGAGDILYRVRSIKEHQEVELMRKAAFAVCKGMEAAIKNVRPGITELDVLAEAEYAMLKAGSSGSSFRPQVVSGERSLLTHPCASNKIINEGEIVVIHLGATYQGYCAKMCRTVAVGEIPSDKEQVYNILAKAQECALAALRPGTTANEVDAAARAVIEEAGFGDYYLDVVGYGVGIRQSEFYPIIGRGRTDIIEVGMVVDLLLPTIYRADIGGPRVTDVIYIGEDKNEILTKYPRDLAKV